MLSNLLILNPAMTHSYRSVPAFCRLSLSALILLASLLAGCATPTITNPPAPTGGFAGRSDAARLNASLKVYGIGDFGAAASAVVEQELSNRMAAYGYRVDTGAPADLEVGVSLETTWFDRSGNFLVGEIAGQVDVRRSGDGRLIASGAETTRGQRVLDEGPATRAAATAFSRWAAGWLEPQLAPAKLGLAADDIEIQLSSDSQMRDYASTFVSEVRQVPGVVDVRVVSQDNARRLLTFRVVYRSDDIPEGLYNRLRGKSRLNLR